MPLPTLFAASTNVAVPGGKHRAVSPIAGKAKFLGLTVERQKEDNWCWAAVAVSVKRFFSPADTTRQCEQAGRQLGLAGCCDDPRPCDQQSRLDVVIFAVEGNRPLSFAEVKQQIDFGRVIAAHITWNDGGAHFACIDGYNEAGAIPLVSVQDPFYGASMVPYDTFVASYLGRGRWDQSLRSR